MPEKELQKKNCPAHQWYTSMRMKLYLQILNSQSFCFFIALGCSEKLGGRSNQ